MPVEPAVEKHWPHLAALTRTLEALDNRSVEVPGNQSSGFSERDIRAIAEGLRRLKRQSGDQGL